LRRGVVVITIGDPERSTSEAVLVSKVQFQGPCIHVAIDDSHIDFSWLEVGRPEEVQRGIDICGVRVWLVVKGVGKNGQPIHRVLHILQVCRVEILGLC
jgi:hypothetical protein